MKKVLICEVDEDYLNELCEVFKKKPLGGIPTHRAWALLEGLKNGIALDELTNGEVIQKMFPEMSEIEVVKDDVVVSDTGTEIVCNFSKKWWNAKLGQMRWICK